MARYVASALVLGALFTIVGFFADAASSGAEGGFAFSFWLTHPRFWIWWFVAGCGLGTLLRYAISSRQP